MNEATAQPVGPLVGTAECYREFIQLCRRQIEALGITYDTCDELCNFPLRYIAKIMAECRGVSVHNLFVLAAALCLPATALGKEEIRGVAPDLSDNDLCS